jgi:hypothetical protein
MKTHDHYNYIQLITINTNWNYLQKTLKVVTFISLSWVLEERP